MSDLFNEILNGEYRDRLLVSDDLIVSRFTEDGTVDAIIDRLARLYGLTDSRPSDSVINWISMENNALEIMRWIVAPDTICTCNVLLTTDNDAHVNILREIGMGKQNGKSTRYQIIGSHMQYYVIRDSQCPYCGVK